MNKDYGDSPHVVEDPQGRRACNQLRITHKVPIAIILFLLLVLRAGDWTGFWDPFREE